MSQEETSSPYKQNTPKEVFTDILSSLGILRYEFVFSLGFNHHQGTSFRKGPL
jgi:hypothetical protein